MRGQRDWGREFEQLQYQLLKECVNATHGSRMELGSQIAGVESPNGPGRAQAGLMDAGPHSPRRSVVGS